MSTDNTNPRSTQATDLQCSREIRLGLVLYGGVSLAIYINGVCQEFFRAVRGRGVYCLLKRLCDSDVVVDIVSGTSAGGVNGIMLSHAIANGLEFGDTANLWREHGGIDMLMNSPTQDDAKSLLNGSGYYMPNLERALRNMASINLSRTAGELVSETPELDLFVTATDFDGRQSTQSDSTGRLIDIKSHAMVFQLKHRQGRKEPFSTVRAESPDTVGRLKALAKLCAMTSCFPIAFEPIHVGVVKDHRCSNDPDFWLTQWGRLSAEAWFVDGGVLDNKPFSYTVQQIFERTSTRPVQRKLFYVEPDPERFDPACQRLRSVEPNIASVARGALVGIPGYESISSDLRAIVKRNEHISQRMRMDPAIYESVLGSSRTVARPSDATVAIYRQVRFIQLSDRVIAGMMKGSQLDRALSADDASISQRASDEHARRHASELRKAFDNWEEGGDGTLRRYDVYFRLRRIYQVIYAVADDVTNQVNGNKADDTDRKAGDAGLQALRQLWAGLNQYLEELVIVRWAMEEMVDSLPIKPAYTDDKYVGLWSEIQRRLDALLCNLRQDSPEQVSKEGAKGDLVAMHQMFSDRLASIVEGPDEMLVGTRNGEPGPTLLETFDVRVGAYLAQDTRHQKYAQCWRDFESVDAFVFPIDFFADVNEKDEINIVRVSPLDADKGFCRRGLEAKVAGETLMHFSAFLKRSWRSNDILWGRLDGSCRLFDGLLDQQAVALAMQSRSARQALRSELDRRPIGQLFEQSPEEACERLSTWLWEVSDDDELRRARAIERRDMFDLLLECAHLEIIAEGLADVYEDATREQMLWNGHWDSSSKATFRPSYERWDSALFLSCARQWTHQHLSGLLRKKSDADRPMASPLGVHFTNDYKVGSETISASIPPAVLLEFCTRALLISRNCILTAVPPGLANAVRSSLIYRMMIKTPLTFAYVLAVFARRERTFSAVLLAALAVYGVFALFVAIEWQETWRVAGGGIKQSTSIAFILVPALIFGVFLRWGWLKAIGAFSSGRRLSALGSFLAFCVVFIFGLWILFAFGLSCGVVIAIMTEQASHLVPAIPRGVWLYLSVAALISVIAVGLIGLPAIRSGIQLASRPGVARSTKKDAKGGPRVPRASRQSNL